jgi:hypothetical protein
MAVFTPGGLCVGAVMWTEGQNAAITVWGDNDQTQEVDGIKAGEKMGYRVWQQATDTEYNEMTVTYAQGDGNYSANGIYVVSALSFVVTGVEERGHTAMPGNFVLHQSFPNPLRASAFRPAATIRYELRDQARIKLTVFDLLGREVRTLASGFVSAGNFEALWDGKDDAGRVVPSGEYLYRLETDGLVLNRKLTLLR